MGRFISWLNAYKAISVTNNGTIPITLSISAGDWIPLIAQQYLTITSNHASGTVLHPGVTEVASQIEWGTLNPGSTVQRPLYKNVGSVPINLNITTNTPTPTSLFTMITFSTDKQGDQIQPTEIAPLVLSITVLPTADPTNFSFNILMAATE